MNDKQTLTLEAGKYYRTRDGRKAFVAGVSPFESIESDRRVVGFIDGDGRPDSWAEHGFRYESKNEHKDDLVAEWVEPKRIKGWVNLYPSESEVGATANTVIHATKRYADALSISTRIACIEIDVLEGHGLNGEGA